MDVSTSLDFILRGMHPAATDVSTSSDLLCDTLPAAIASCSLDTISSGTYQATDEKHLEI